MAHQKVLITGIHIGLGHALAKKCLAAGSRVYGVSRTRPPDLADESGLRFAQLDLRQFHDIDGVLAELLDGVTSLDLALLNAGVLGEIKDLRDSSLEELQNVMDINVWANKAVIDTLLRTTQVSQVVAISSGAALNGSGGWGAYAISKSALNLLVRVYAHEHSDTHFTALAPGIVDTNMIRDILAQPEEPRHPANARIREAQKEGRVVSPDVAAANLLARIPDLLEQPSGAYLDIRQM
ncbi:SDR family NAD(P)-dependent oxidoreductase [Myxococcota bacterium]